MPVGCNRFSLFDRIIRASRFYPVFATWRHSLRLSDLRVNDTNPFIFGIFCVDTETRDESELDTVVSLVDATCGVPTEICVCSFVSTYV